MGSDPTEVLGRRVVATIIDLVALFVLGLVLAALIGDTETGDGSFSFQLEGAAFFVWSALSLAYYLVLEATTGQTLGKKLLGIRVASADGTSKPGFGQVALRTLLRLIDGLFFYAVALAVALATGERRQRIGDLVGRTVVVRAS